MEKRVVTSPSGLVVAGLTSLLIVGCGPGGPPVVKVTANVRYQGEPVEGATVIFSNASGTMESGALATGTTDAQGNASLTTTVSPTLALSGATPGEYRVIISKSVPPQGMTEEEFEEKVLGGQTALESVPLELQEPPPVRSDLLPPKYSSSTESTLTATVTADGPNEFKFDLQ